MSLIFPFQIMSCGDTAHNTVGSIQVSFKGHYSQTYRSGEAGGTRQDASIQLFRV